VSAHAASHSLITFEKQTLTREFWAEGAAVGDFNRDGKKDIVSGPFWYAGPDFKTRHEIHPATNTFTTTGPDGKKVEIPGYEGGLGTNNAYSQNFLSFVHDVNGDGWDDVLVFGMPGEAAIWHENPRGRMKHWAAHVALDVADNESQLFADLTGDGRPEIICSSKGFYGWAEPDRADPRRPWIWHSLSPNNNYHRYTHGLGIGDVNGDGRMDLLEKDGWWEQPESLEGDPVWKHHPFAFGTGGAQMFAYDVNGDGRNDVITSLTAHGYGLAWFENVPDGAGGITFRERTFMNKEPSENRYGVKFSQLHALALTDVNRDGLKDIITGKRFWAHGPTGDPEPGAPAVLYWFQLTRLSNGEIDFIPWLVDDDSGVGTQVVVEDVSGDGRVDIVVGNKKGLFVHTQKAREVSEAEWTAARPKPAETR
jgi:hypothetical protein